MTTPTAAFGVTEDGRPAFFDHHGRPHFVGTVTFSAAHIELLDRFEDDEATDADFATISDVFPLLWEVDEL